jgi:hypothetical protein
MFVVVAGAITIAGRSARQLDILAVMKTVLSKHGLTLNRRCGNSQIAA